MRAPQQECLSRRTRGANRGDHRIGHLPPAEFGMRVGQARFHRQHAIEKQHTLLRPSAQVAMCGGCDAEIIFHTPINIAQRCRYGYTARNGERQPHGVARSRVWILPQYYRPHFFRRDVIERCKPVSLRRQNMFAVFNLAFCGSSRTREMPQRIFVKQRPPIRGKCILQFFAIFLCKLTP